MAALYPTTLYQHTGACRDLDLGQDEFNQIGDEVAALQLELGTSPKGAFGSVASRLSALDSGQSSLFATAILQNLKITNDSTSPNSKLAITADSISVSGAILNNVSVTADLTVTGAGGIQSGQSRTANTWYYVWLIYNTTSLTVSGFLTTTATPTLPSGYDKYRRVGMARVGLGSFLGSSSTDFGRFLIQDRVCRYYSGSAPWNLVTNSQSPLISSSSLQVNCSAWVPPSSRHCVISVLAENRATGNALNVRWRPIGFAASGQMVVAINPTVSGSAVAQAAVWLSVSQLLDMGWSASPTAQVWSADVADYTDPI